MAAVTVEDCLRIIPNRFELALVASYRAKQLMNGSPMLYVSEKIEKNTVVALREIAADLLDIEKIMEELKSNIKNQTLFKSFNENIIYDDKKDSDLEDITLNSGMADDSDDKDVEDDEIIEDDDDEEYYKNLDSGDLGDDSADDDLEK